MKMKKSNEFLATLGLLIFLMMFFTNFNLVQEYKKIDLSDPFKNYISQDTEPYTVLKLTGSNGYPIEVRQADENELKLLRSRTEHLTYRIHADTLFIEFTGARISKQQSMNSTSPAAIIIQKSRLPEIIATDIHCKISDFKSEEMKLSIEGNALAEIKDCHFNRMEVGISQQGHLEFFHQNSIDSLQLNMANTSVAFLKNVNLHHIQQDLGDSIAIVLSNHVFSAFLNKPASN
ncbi:MAG: DUF2807 domain-containing protein [Bacteroidia bacterium]|nr:DUF2807 domain-containing protein [Bacteroidia bacterium]